MRVYGTSPLYNYVELIFRSKRLFIGSIVIATLATMFFYFYRASNYTAHNLVMLTGTVVQNPNDKEERGTVQYKLNILSVAMRDPLFIKQALKDERLDRSLSGPEFDKFAKDVKDKVSYAVDNNVLEISCTWPDERAANIVTAIYGAYRRKVIASETEVSTANTALMKDLLTEYQQKRNDVELKVADYEKKHVLIGLVPDPGPASSQYQQAETDVTRLQAEKELADSRFKLLQDQFAKTSPTYEESVVRQGEAKDPTYVNAGQQLQLAQNDLADLKIKYTDSNPKVKAAQERVDDLAKQVKKFTSSKTGPTKPGPILNRTQSANPAWITLDNQVKQEQITLKGIEMQLEQAQAHLAEARKRAIISPGAQYDYRRMTDNLGLYSSFTSTFATNLENAMVNERRDKALKMLGIEQKVAPEAEKETKGAKGLLMLGAGPLIGIIIAFSFSLLAESMDHSLRTPLEIEKHLGKPVLAVLPSMNTGRESARRQIGGDATRPTLPSS